MDRLTDLELLRQYAASGSDEAFRLVVQRHLGLVRGTALRQLGSEHHADEVSHAVFLALARKAGSLREGTVLAGWLFRATRFAAAKLARDEERRSRRQKEAAMIHAEISSETDANRELWDKITPHLDDALVSLGKKDRDAVLLRFFEQRPFAEVGKNMGTSEDAAKMRVGRALEKLRIFFRKRGFVVGVTALSGAFSANAAAAVPPDQSSAVASAVLRLGGTKGAVAALADSIWRHLWLRQVRFWLMIAGVGLLTGMLIWLGQPSATPVWRPPTPPRQPWPPR